MAKTGDRIVIMGKTKNATSRDRGGVIEQVLNEDPPRYLIRWDSGSSTVLSPGPGTVRIEEKPAKVGKKAAAKPPKDAKRSTKR